MLCARLWHGWSGGGIGDRPVSASTVASRRFRLSSSSLQVLREDFTASPGLRGSLVRSGVPGSYARLAPVARPVPLKRRQTSAPGLKPFKGARLPWWMTGDGEQELRNNGSQCSTPPEQKTRFSLTLPLQKLRKTWS